MMMTPPTQRRNRRGHTSLSSMLFLFVMKPFSLSLSLSPRRFRLYSPLGKTERRERNLAPKRKREKEFARVNSHSSFSLSLSLSLRSHSPPLKARQIPEEKERERERERINARVLYEAHDGPKPQTFPTHTGKTTTTTRKRLCL